MRIQAILYGIEVARVAGQDRPILRHAFTTETKLSFMVEGVHGFLNYRTRISKKEEKGLAFTAKQAWQYYIDRCYVLRVSLSEQEERMTSFQRMAISELMSLSEGEA